MKRPRDYQRQRVYNAETRCFGQPVEGLTLDKCKEFLNSVVTKMNLSSVTINDGRGRGRAGAYHNNRIIALPKFARREWVICHELAHLETPNNVPAHGPEFCKNYLEIVKKALGEEFSVILKETFLESGVDVDYIK